MAGAASTAQAEAFLSPFAHPIGMGWRPCLLSAPGNHSQKFYLHFLLHGAAATINISKITAAGGPRSSHWLQVGANRSCQKSPSTAEPPHRTPRMGGAVTCEHLKPTPKYPGHVPSAHRENPCKACSQAAFPWEAGPPGAMPGRAKPAAAPKGKPGLWPQLPPARLNRSGEPSPDFHFQDDKATAACGPKEAVKASRAAAEEALERGLHSLQHRLLHASPAGLSLYLLNRNRLL